MRNWAGNVTFHAARVHHPASVDDVRRIVAGARRVRALGTGHSFSPIADTSGDLVALDALPKTITIDPAAREVTVGPGVRYGELAIALHAAGFALHNMGSLPHISVGGAVATATHGSGTRTGCLSTAVSAMELITSSGDLITIRRDVDEWFDGAVVSLGALGIVASVTLRIEPTYEVAQVVYENLPVAELDLDLFDAGYSVSVFTRWRSSAFDQVWVKKRGAWDPPATLRGATRATAQRHMVPGISPDATTPQRGVAGPWHERLPHFRLDFTPSVGHELQSEFLVRLADGPAALAALDGVRQRIAPLLAISELRTVAADQLWLSPAYRRDSFAIHFTWVDDVAGVTALLPEIEAALAPFAPRPHWGKIFLAGGAYPRMADFAMLRTDLDPAGTFGNDFLDAYLDRA